MLKKGRVLSPADVELIAAAGLDADRRRRGSIPAICARTRRPTGSPPRSPAPDIAAAAAFTGRANLFAEAHGLLVFDRDRLDRLNLVDEAVTLGTLPPFAVVEPRQMVATVKIIPFAVPEAAVARRRGIRGRTAGRCCGSRPSRRAGSR